MSDSSFVAKLSFLLSGFIIWAAHFGLLYGINGLACARGVAMRPMAGANLVSVSVGAATVVAVIAILAVMIVAAVGRGPGIGEEGDTAIRSFWRFGTIAIGFLGVISVLWSGLPAAIVRPCA